MTDRTDKISVHFGALCEPLWEQLECPPSWVAQHQAQADAIVKLHVGGLLTDRETHRARSRLVKKIVKTLEKRRANG